MTAHADAPDSFAYHRNLAAGRRGLVGRVATMRIKEGPLEFPAEIVSRLGADRLRGDELSDAMVEACFADKTVGRLRGWVEAGLDHGIDAVPDASPEVVAFFAHLTTEPAWLDWERVERGARIFRQYGVDAFYYFGVMSIDGYRRESIYKPLVLTGAYTGGSAFGRFLETCRFWTDVSEPGALRPGGAGRRTATLVRMMHSMIRHHVEKHDEWDGERLGRPLNQLDQLGTLLFSFLLTQHLTLLGYRATPDEVLDHMHFWRYVGYLLGVEPSFYPETMDDWYRLGFVLYTAGETADCDDSRRLSQSFLAAFAPTGSEPAVHQQEKLRECREVEEYAAYFALPSALRAAGIAPLRWRRLRPVRHLPGNVARGWGRRTSPDRAARLDREQRANRREWIDRHLAGRTPAFTPVDKLSR